MSGNRLITDKEMEMYKMIEKLIAFIQQITPTASAALSAEVAYRFMNNTGRSTREIMLQTWLKETEEL